MTLSEKELERYNRHIILDKIGEVGQEKIKNTSVLVVGAGGLGSPVLLYLSAAGIGKIGIIDDDKVSESNLQRQILYDSFCINEDKCVVAKDRIRRLNPFCEVVEYTERLSYDNARKIINLYDIVVDATDNLESRYVINSVCFLLQKPFVYGSVKEFTGQISVFNYKDGPSFTDLYEYNENTINYSQPLGIIGALPGIVGSIQATEVIKIILDAPGVLSGKLLTIDTWNNNYLIFNIKR